MDKNAVPLIRADERGQRNNEGSFEKKEENDCENNIHHSREGERKVARNFLVAAEKGD